MQNENHDDDQDEGKKIIHFPALETRAAHDKKKRKAEKQRVKDQKAHTAQEDLWRKQYRAQQAKNMADKARGKSSGKTPFINWDKIPPFSRALLGVCLLVQILTTLILSDGETLRLFHTFGFVPASLTGDAPFTPLTLITPITSLFIHSDWMHFTINMIMLLVMSVFFERHFGSKYCIIFFFVCGLCGNLLYFAMDPQNMTPVIGASGAISGLFAVNMLVMSENGMMGRFSQDNNTAKFLLVWIMIIIVPGLAFGGVAWQAHLGGFLGGALLYTLWKRGKIRF